MKGAHIILFYATIYNRLDDRAIMVLADFSKLFMYRNIQTVTCKDQVKIKSHTGDISKLDKSSYKVERYLFLSYQLYEMFQPTSIISIVPDGIATDKNFVTV